MQRWLIFLRNRMSKTLNQHIIFKMGNSKFNYFLSNSPVTLKRSHGQGNWYERVNYDSCYHYTWRYANLMVFAKPGKFINCILWICVQGDYKAKVIMLILSTWYIIILFPDQSVSGVVTLFWLNCFTCTNCTWCTPWSESVYGMATLFWLID